MVLADVRWHEGAKQAFTLARRAGVITVLDGDVTPGIASWWPLSPAILYLFSEPGLARLTEFAEESEAGLKKAQALTNGHVYVTRGGKAVTG